LANGRYFSKIRFPSRTLSKKSILPQLHIKPFLTVTLLTQLDWL